MKWLRSIGLAMTGAAAGLLFYSGSFFVKSYLENQQARDKYEEIQETYTAFEEEEKDPVLQKKKTEPVLSVLPVSPAPKKEIEESFGIHWKELRQVNPQIAGWVQIPGGDISYPVVQGEDNSFYLSHSFERKEDLFGTIFLDWRNRKRFQDSHSFLYGHNMEGNMMFANLNRYESQEYLEQCPEIYLYTPWKKYRYLIFSVEQAEEGSTSFSYGQKLKSTEFKDLLQYMKNRSFYDTGVEPEAFAPILTLVTCNSRLDENIRMLVHGTRVETWSWNEERE